MVSFCPVFLDRPSTILTGIFQGILVHGPEKPHHLRDKENSGEVEKFYWKMDNLENEIMNDKIGYEKYEKEGKGKSQSDFLIRHIYLPVLTKLTFSSGFSAGPSEVRSS